MGRESKGSVTRIITLECLFLVKVFKHVPYGSCLGVLVLSVCGCEDEDFHFVYLLNVMHSEAYGRCPWGFPQNACFCSIEEVVYHRFLIDFLWCGRGVKEKKGRVIRDMTFCKFLCDLTSSLLLALPA